MVPFGFALNSHRRSLNWYNSLHWSITTSAKNKSTCKNLILQSNVLSFLPNLILWQYPKASIRHIHLMPRDKFNRKAVGSKFRGEIGTNCHMTTRCGMLQ